MATSAAPNPSQGAIIALGIICGLLIIGVLLLILLFVARARSRGSIDGSIIPHPSHHPPERHGNRELPIEYSSSSHRDLEELKDFASEATVGSDNPFDSSGATAYPSARIPYAHMRRPIARENHIHFQGKDTTAEIPHAHFQRKQSRNEDLSHHIRQTSRDGFIATETTSSKDSRPT